MVSPDIMHTIHELEIYTRRLLSGSLVGDSRSALKGSGFEFDQLREYQMGDDIRFIDWNSSSRTNTLMVRQYRQERSRTIILMVDISASTAYASGAKKRSEVIGSIASVLALVAQYGKDEVGLLLFSDRVHTFIPPSRTKLHTRYIMQTIFTQIKQPTGTTNITQALTYVAGLKYKNAILFLISDYIQPCATEQAQREFKTALRIVAKRHDCIAVRCLDQYEKQFPGFGFITMQDSEQDVSYMFDARNAQAVQTLLADRLAHQDTLFKQCGVDVLSVQSDRPFMADIVRFFARRMLY